MKKILATVLALTMIVGMSITAFAATQSFNAVGTSQDIDVNATFKTQDATENTAAVYYVTITWEDISFEYTAASNVYGWNPSDLEYNDDIGDNAGAWKDAKFVIAIENRSNASVTVTPTWKGEVDGVQPAISGAVTLASAVGAGEGGANAPTTAEITVEEPATGAITAAGKLGTITLTIA